MNQVVIENPIINSPFEEPKRHFRFTEDGITNEIIEKRRISSYFIPIPKPKEGLWRRKMIWKPRLQRSTRSASLR
jgi:hypothetical protein